MASSIGNGNPREARTMKNLGLNSRKDGLGEQRARLVLFLAVYCFGLTLQFEITVSSCSSEDKLPEVNPEYSFQNMVE